MTQKSIKLNEQQFNLFVEELRNLGINKEKYPGNTDYELIRFKQGNEFLVVYNNMTILFNQSERFEALINTIISDNLDEIYQNYDLVIGSDEVGKGEWYGPLITVAVCLKREDIPKLQTLGVKDSKKLKRNQIFDLFKKSHQIKFKRHSVITKPLRLNELWQDFIKENKNYNDLIAWQHQRAIFELLKSIDASKKILIIIDKFDVKKVDSRLKNLFNKQNIKIQQISKGEKYIPVALASIIAKKIWYEEIESINENFNITLPKSEINDINPDIVSQIGKLFFKNVRCITNNVRLKNNLENLLLTQISTINLFDSQIRKNFLAFFRTDKNIYNYLNSAYKFELKSNEAQSNELNSKKFIEVIENENNLKNALAFLKESDPDFMVKRYITNQLKQKLDELDNIDFKYCLNFVDKIAKTISAFCNRYILTRTQSYIVFGVKDRNDMEGDFAIEERIIPLKTMLKESKVKNVSEFQFKVNDLVIKHLSPCPDSCFTLKSLNLKDYGSIEEDIWVMVIIIKDFTLDRPIYFNREIYIRKGGQDLKAMAEEIEQLTKKLIN